ncbi:MAG: TetR/AcrR family transcriptional regulator [Deltaproteobacteria bacterium]|nr:TetR/AcrR family transcriptional regulator [Deltaproteobacteria bacterium]MBW2726216.1 TetR/AcrR family transcriptional regulator [Deltaproteobacteria bacterium]
MKQVDRKTESRKRIIEAAREVFFREDYMGASVDEIAAAAGISKGAVYRHFESKASLYVTVLAENGSVWDANLQNRVKANAQLASVERLRDLWAFYLEHWLEYPDHFRIFWAIDNEAVIGELPKELAERVSDFWKESLRVPQKILDEGIERGDFIDCDTWQTAHTFWTVATAIIEHDATRGRRRIRQRPLKEIYDHSIELILRGILTDPSQSRLPGQ